MPVRLSAAAKEAAAKTVQFSAGEPSRGQSGVTRVLHVMFARRKDSRHWQALFDLTLLRCADIFFNTRKAGSIKDS